VITIDRVGRSDTETPARLPDEHGMVERYGVGIHWESYGDRGPAVLLLPSWSIVHSRLWKGQIAYLARRFRVVTFDGRGNGLSDRPGDASAYAEREYVADALAVLDAAGLESVVVAGISKGGLRALLLASCHPERVLGAFVISPTVTMLSPGVSGREAQVFAAELDEHEGWAKYNRAYWRRDYAGFVEFFFSQAFPEPHSTKQREDAVAWGLDTDAETLIRTVEGGDPGLADVEAAEAMCRRVRCPVAVVHGTEDGIVPPDVGRRVAELTGAELVWLEGSGHMPASRDPVQVNRLLRAFVERVAGEAEPPAPRTWTRSLVRPKRALFVSSPIGLGHAWRDVAIADALRRVRSGIEIEWLAQEPVTTLLRERGEAIHPASAELASEAQHIDREAGEHDLHAFEAIRRMDEILCANFMVFHDLVSEEAFDVWVGDEAWEVDHFLHENPELKTAPYVWLTDFVGYLPMPAGGELEASVAADYNAEMIEHVERFPGVRDRAIFVGHPEDIVPGTFGPGLPDIREWTGRHYSFAGYIAGFDPRTVTDRAALRASLGYGDEPLCVVAVGGSGVGAPLLHRVIEALPLARERVPGLRTLVVTGPRIDPSSLPAVEGLEVRGYVHELYRHLAACDAGVVQGGLTTTMELVAAGRPFVSFPLASHFEQQFHVRHRLDRYGAHDWLDFADAGPERVADAIVTALGSQPTYRRIVAGGAARAATMIAELV
jgi:pimeloyl-ACP methyl ester carboxylesterase/predicted glycosyltransferase